MRVVKGIKYYDVTDIVDGARENRRADYFNNELVSITGARRPTFKDVEEMFERLGLEFNGRIVTDDSSVVFDRYMMTYICLKSMDLQVTIRQLENAKDDYSSKFPGEDMESLTETLTGVIEELQTKDFGIDARSAALERSVIFLFRDVDGQFMLEEIFTGYPKAIVDKYFSYHMPYHCNECLLFKSQMKTPSDLIGKWRYKIMKPEMNIKYVCGDCARKVKEEGFQYVGT